MSDEPTTERVRWRWDRRTFATPEEHDAHLWDGDPGWLAVGRNHRTWHEDGESGIERQVRDDDEFVEILDEHGAKALADLVVGRRIVAIERDPYSGSEWGHGENSVTVTLDDGARLVFVGEGYDASSLITSYAPPVAAQDEKEQP